MSVRVYNLAELAADLYNRIPSDGEHELLMANTTDGDMTPTLYKYVASSSAADDFPRVIKPTLQTGNGRWLRQNSYGFVLPGTLSMYGGSTAPVGYLLCDGSTVSRTTQKDLFDVIGTSYGTGDGTTTFTLPDLRQRFPLGKSSSGTGSTLGGTGGTIDHIHSIDAPNTTTTAPSATVTGISLLGVAGAASDTHTHDVNIAAFDSGTNNPPYQVVNYIIKS